METAVIVSQICHVIAALAFGWFILGGYRWIRRRSEVVGAIVAIAILGRVAIGLALFWISYLQLPLAESIQVGGGFWQPALDATGYYQMATHAADARTLYVLDHSVPSPFFVNTLALWMMAVGISPAAGMFLNLCLYLALVAMVVWCFVPVNEWRRDLPCIVGVAAYSFSPVVLIHSTQPLKDELSNVYAAMACLGVLAITRLMYSPVTTRHRWAIATGCIAVTAAIFGTAGIRWYYGLVIWCALALALAIFAVRGRTTPLRRYLTGCFAVLVAAWLAFWGGAGPYYQLIGANLGAVGKIVQLPYDLATMTQLSRTGFLMSGGGTNIIVPLREDPSAGHIRMKQLEAAQHAGAAYQERLAKALRGEAATATQVAAAERTGAVPAAPPPALAGAFIEAHSPKARAARAIPVNLREQLMIVATGLAILFVPLSLFNAVAGVEISGGRGLLSIADFDTVFLDAAIVLVLVLLWRRRHAIGDRLPFVVFGLILSGATAVLFGYVVTNYGTLWRMRSLVAVPLWLLVVALSPRAETPRESSDVHEHGYPPGVDMAAWAVRR